jgi:NADH:ubiquinone oxidoreductase subunit
MPSAKLPYINMAIKSLLTTDQIIKLYEKNISVYDIAIKAEVTEAAIWKRLRVIDYPMRRTCKGTHWRKNEGQEEYLGIDGRYWVRNYRPDRNKRSERRYIVVMEKHLGCKIPKGWVVHHIDEDPTNDDIDNLALMTNKAHLILHHKGKKNPKKNCWKKDIQGKYYK